MLILPDGNRHYRVLAIDPGTDTLGVAVLDLDLSTFEVSIVHTVTLKASKQLKFYPEMAETYGDRFTKIYSHSVQLKNLLFIYQPQAVISEAPYLRFVTSFEALIECLMMIKQTVCEYNPTITVETIDPPRAKMAVGAPGKGGDKEDVKQAVLRLTCLKNPTGIDLNAIDEHSVDAIAVGCYKLRNFITVKQ